MFPRGLVVLDSPRLDSQARKKVITFGGLWGKGWKEGLKREIEGGN